MRNHLVAIAAVAIASLSVAKAADMRVRVAPPRTTAVVEDCVRYAISVENWNRGPVTFRVTAKGGLPNSPVQIAVKQQGNTICIPKALFRADVVQICIGDTSRDHSNSRLIQGRWMEDTRRKIAAGVTVINPNDVMHFRYNGPSNIGGPRYPGMYPRPVMYPRHPGIYRSGGLQPIVLAQAGPTATVTITPAPVMTPLIVTPPAPRGGTMRPVYFAPRASFNDYPCPPGYNCPTYHYP